MWPDLTTSELGAHEMQRYLYPEFVGSQLGCYNGYQYIDSHTDTSRAK